MILQIDKLRFVLTPCLYGVARSPFQRWNGVPCRLHARRKLTRIRLFIPCKLVRFDEGINDSVTASCKSTWPLAKPRYCCLQIVIAVGSMAFYKWSRLLRVFIIKNYTYSEFIIK